MILKSTSTYYNSNNNNNNNNYNSSSLMEIFKNILIKIPTHNDSIFVLNNLNQFPSNCIFNVTLLVSSLLNQDFNGYGSSGLRINKIKLGGVLNSNSNNNNEMNIIFNNILKLNPVSITYFPNISYYEKSNIDTSIFFKDCGGRLEYFKTLDNVEPMDIASLSLKSKLKSITVPLAFHQIIRTLHYNKYNIVNNSDENYNEICSGNFTSFRNDSSMEADWNSMIKVLSNHSKLKELSLFNNCGDTYDCLDQHYDTSLINSGISTILNNSNCNIEILTLEGYGFIDSTFINSLSSNKSIRTLRLVHCHEEMIFNQVLNGSNRYIRNVIVESNILSNQLLKLFKSLSNLELYSISFMNESIESLNESLIILSSPSSTQLNIKEINFYLLESTPSTKHINNNNNNNKNNNNNNNQYNHQYNKSFINNHINSTIINIFYKSKDELGMWDLSEYSDSDTDNNHSFGYNDD